MPAELWFDRVFAVPERAGYVLDSAVLTFVRRLENWAEGDILPARIEQWK